MGDHPIAELASSSSTPAGVAFSPFRPAVAQGPTQVQLDAYFDMLRTVRDNLPEKHFQDAATVFLARLHKTNPREATFVSIKHVLLEFLGHDRHTLTSKASGSSLKNWRRELKPFRAAQEALGPAASLLLLGPPAVAAVAAPALSPAGPALAPLSDPEPMARELGAALPPSGAEVIVLSSDSSCSGEAT